MGNNNNQVFMPIKTNDNKQDKNNRDIEIYMTKINNKIKSLENRIKTLEDKSK